MPETGETDLFLARASRALVCYRVGCLVYFTVWFISTAALSHALFVCFLFCFPLLTTARVNART